MDGKENSSSAKMEKSRGLIRYFIIIFQNFYFLLIKWIIYPVYFFFSNLNFFVIYACFLFRKACSIHFYRNFQLLTSQK